MGMRRIFMYARMGCRRELGCTCLGTKGLKAWRRARTAEEVNGLERRLGVDVHVVRIGKLALGTMVALEWDASLCMAP